MVENGASSSEDQQAVSEVATPASDVDRRLDAVLSSDWRVQLESDSYEEASRALSEVKTAREWRKAERESSFRPFFRLIEGAGMIAHAQHPETQKAELRTALSDRLIGKTRYMTPRVADLYTGLLAALDGSPYTPQYKITQDKLDSLAEEGDLDLLLRDDTPSKLKLNRVYTRLEGELKGRAALDRRDKLVAREEKEGEDEAGEDEQMQEGERTADDNPEVPDDSDESKPSMDEMDRLKEGEEATAVWTIAPAYGGYYKEKSFDTWDPATNTWRQTEYKFTPAQVTPDENLDDNNPQKIILSAHVGVGQIVRVPKPYTHAYISGTAGDCYVEVDQNGDYRLKTAQHGGTVQLNFARHVGGEITSPETPKVLTMPYEFSEETEQKLKEVQLKKRGNIAKANTLKAFVMRRLTYSNDSSYNALYENYPQGYAVAVDTFKKADCDVGNTYFAALCSRLGIPVRHVVGHMVKGKDEAGNGRVTRGTGHAWTEVWDERRRVWVRMDATPPGDPLFQEEEQEQQQPDGMEGDYPEEEAIGPTDKELQELEEKLTVHTEKLSYTPEERYLSEKSGVPLAEARKIVREIAQAEDTRLPNGERVVDVMSNLFKLLIDSRKAQVRDYTGPLRKREGGEYIEDIVEHAIGIESGDLDPASRQKEQPHEEIKEVFDSMDVMIVGDKSGSMGETVDGEKKWETQRRVEYLIFSAFHRFDQNLQKSREQMIEPLSVRTQGISFRGSGDDELDEDKPLSSSFTPENKVRLWHSLGNQGYGNGDVAALEHIHAQIKKEKEELELQGEKDKRIRMVIVCSDGEPDDPVRVKQLAQELGEMGCVVVGIGLTETAAKVPLIFDTPYSRGDIAKDINDLPAIVAKHVVWEAARLFPDRGQKNYQKIVEAMLAKFPKAA